MEYFQGKRLLILGGSRISCEIVRKAKEMGLHTMVTDWYEIEKSPAKQIADKAFMVSTADIDAVVKLIKDERVDGVITGFTDSVLPYYAEICEKAGLPFYGTKEQFEILTNKKLYKKLCLDYDVPVVDEYKIREDSNEEDFEKIKYPVLVKPADNSGARGITICHTKKQLIEACKLALKFSENKEILVERYIDGEEVTVFYIFQDGNVYLSAISDRHVKHNQEEVIPLPVAYTFPSKYMVGFVENILPNVKKMFESLGLKNGMLFAQCLVEDGEVILYDLGYRLTGSLEYKLLKVVSGYDPLEMMINFAITGKIHEDNIEDYVNPDFKPLAANITFLVKPGQIGKISGLDQILNMPKVIDAVLAHVEGDTIPETAKGTLRQIVLRVFATGETMSELADIIDKVHKAFRVESIDGEDMLLETFDTDELRVI